MAALTEAEKAIARDLPLTFQFEALCDREDDEDARAIIDDLFSNMTHLGGCTHLILDRTPSNADFRADLAGNVDILQAIIEVVVSTHKPRQPTPTLTRSTLRDRLKKCRGAENADPLLVVVLDEASSLLRKSPSDAGPYVAMDRVFSCLKEFPLWLFSLSTESQVGKLLPPDKSMVVEDDDVDDYSMRSLARIPEGYRSSTGSKLRLLPPFVAFPLDISDREKMRNPTAKATELSKPMSQFVRFEHLAMFGRPLWTAYTDHLDLYKLAKLKLTGGHSESFNPENKHEVFAALSFRLSLDVCVENSGSLPLLRTAVGAYMRVVLSVNQRSGYLETTTPSEPILAQAAMDFLCEVTNWQMSIKTLTNNLLREGLIEKGLKGELFARLVMILAQDWIRWKSDPPKSAPPILAPAFSARDFLTSLYAESAHGQIEKIPPKILDGKLNFTHFTSTRENLSPEVIPTLCQDILRRGAALQLAPGQPTYDQLIPFYCGDPDKHYAQSKYGVILIQDKNRAGGTTPDHIFHENFETVVPGTQINTRRRNWNPLESIRKR
ncbi:hypothetical protein AJ80_05899 [Polytolypa hystricis UAMH7299]|uniref:Uncharacterized protein n=1 Tax=Polytolypa hystricis (strain UAMH7299) TaxID=1447883 RepID=A0A2B7XRR3_POLH7|nr:hypothetical protein AJ80_05899 [Polytolypa hystricis UAMH7299]